MTGRAPCVPGCTCKKHVSAAGRSKCPEGCTCKRHARPKKIRWESAEEKRAYDREYMRKRRADPEIAEKGREASRDYVRRNPYWVKYRMSKDDWERMFARQGGKCYLCNDELIRDSRKSTHIDHDHMCCPGDRTCGKCVRGIACSWCNQGIGQFRDDPDRMIRAASALRAANTRVRSQINE